MVLRSFSLDGVSFHFLWELAPQMVPGPPSGTQFFRGLRPLDPRFGRRDSLSFKKERLMASPPGFTFQKHRVSPWSLMLRAEVSFPFLGLGVFGVDLIRTPTGQSEPYSKLTMPICTALGSRIQLHCASSFFPTEPWPLLPEECPSASPAG